MKCSPIQYEVHAVCECVFMYSKLMTKMIYWNTVPLEQNPFSCLGRFPVWWRLCGHFQGFVCVSECEIVWERGRQRGWGVGGHDASSCSVLIVLHFCSPSSTSVWGDTGGRAPKQRCSLVMEYWWVERWKSMRDAGGGRSSRTCRVFLI